MLNYRDADAADWYANSMARGPISSPRGTEWSVKTATDWTSIVKETALERGCS